MVSRFSTGHTTLNVQMLNQRQLIIVALINTFQLTKSIVKQAIESRAV